MQLRTKIIVVFFLSLIMSITIFLLTIYFLSSSPFGGGYNEKDMNRAADELAAKISTVPELSKSNIAPIFSMWLKKYPNMNITIVAPDMNVLLSSGKNIGFNSNQQMLKFLQSGSLMQLSKEKTKPLPPVLPKQAKQVMIFSNNITMKKTAGQLSKMPDNKFFYSVKINNPGERILAREIKQFDETVGYLLISVAVKYYTSIELFTDFQKMGIITQIIMIGLGITLIFTSIFAVVFTRNISRRFTRLCAEINSFELGNLNVNCADHSNDEIGQLANAFNHMTAKISHQITQEKIYHEQRQQLVSNISHDLRTPLTSIIGYAESLENGIYNNTNEQQKYSGIIRKRALYMEKLLGELLEFSRMELNNFELQKNELDLAELSREILIEYLPLITEQAITLETDIPERPILVSIDANRFSRALRNLIDNALKYGNRGKYLGLKITEVNNAQMIFISIEDKGEGISEEECLKIFDRFYRVDKGRNTTEGGAGLGLAIAQEIIKKHSGQITVRSEVGQGTIFTIELPVHL